MSIKSKSIWFVAISLIMLGILTASLMLLSPGERNPNAVDIAFWSNLFCSVLSSVFAFSLLRKVIALSAIAKIAISLFVFTFPGFVIGILLIAEIAIFVMFMLPIQLQERESC